jgi:hypothetical protein
MNIKIATIVLFALGDRSQKEKHSAGTSLENNDSDLNQFQNFSFGTASFNQNYLRYTTGRENITDFLYDEI